jgi:hypothetical protein
LTLGYPFSVNDGPVFQVILYAALASRADNNDTIDLAVLGTQIVATVIAVYGFFMTPLGWGWAMFVWGYALVWFLINDRLKLPAYRIFDSVKAKSKPAGKEEPEPEAFR